MTFEAHRECDQDADLHVIGNDLLAEVRRLIVEMNNPAVSSRPAVERLLQDLDEAPITTGTCPFEGVVAMSVVGARGRDAVLAWTCPTCGYEHREEPD